MDTVLAALASTIAVGHEQLADLGELARRAQALQRRTDDPEERELAEILRGAIIAQASHLHFQVAILEALARSDALRRPRSDG